MAKARPARGAAGRCCPAKRLTMTTSTGRAPTRPGFYTPTAIDLEERADLAASKPTRARIMEHEYDVVNFVFDADPYPYWVLRDVDGDMIVRDDDAEPSRRVMGRCDVCGQFTLSLAYDGRSRRGPQWVCLAPDCVGPEATFLEP
jgi:hypothetical protein